MEALIYFLLWAVFIFLMMRFGCGAHIMGHGNKQHDSNSPEVRRSDVRWVPPETDTDPVCGKNVRTDQARASVHDGMVYYFCSRECRERFESAPDLYVGSGNERQPKKLESANG